MSAPQRKPKEAEQAWPSIVFTLQRRPATVADLAKITNLAENAVSKVLLLLEVEGLVTRTKVGHADLWTWEPDA